MKDVHASTCEFIQAMSPIWSTSSSRAVVEDLEKLGVRIVKDEKQTAVPNDEKAIFKVLESHQKQIDAIRELTETARHEVALLASEMNGQTSRIAKLESRADHHRARAEDATKHLANHSERLRNLQDRICKLEPDHELHAPAKRTIKGGWVNVYLYAGFLTTHISPVIFRTRKECDTEGTAHRIACIQIPDITEGEGL